MKNFKLNAAVLTLTLVLTIAIGGQLNAQTDNGNRGRRAPFTGIVSFGDSLSDTGNLFAATGFPPTE